MPSSLSTYIFPPCFSTNSLQSNNPNPVPVSPAVPLVVSTTEISNSFERLSVGMPTPLSETEMVTFSESCSALIFILPPQFENLIALETRLRSIVLVMSISA